MKPKVEEDPDRDANLSKLDVALSELHEINSSFGMAADEVKKDKKKSKKKKKVKIEDRDSPRS